MSLQSHIPIGQLLLDKGIITGFQLDQALEKQKITGKRLGITLLELGFIDEEAIFLPVVAGQTGVDFIDVKHLTIPQDVIKKIPAKFIIYYKILPIDFKNDTLTIATSHPSDINLLDEMGLIISHRIKTVLAGEKDILETIRKYYGVGAETIEEMMTEGAVEDGVTESIADLELLDSDASISKFLNQILLEAHRDKATDIHIEPFEDALKIRYRIDGALYDAKVPSNIKHFKDSINSRIKVLSNLNIAEKRLPQDGRFKVRVSGIDLDLRVSFLPTPYGESVVLRLLNSARLFGFQELGLASDEIATLEKLIQKPNGIIFVTGPTGSGKTTTLYSCLSRINTEDKKIITIEDPVEYQLKGITQIQINPALGLTFAQGLRSMLRHDPDVMMVGEVRDIETAEIAIQVALTGHLVFSTLHTNDAAGGVTRLVDMGAEPYLITSTVQCFIAQRLLRLLCFNCKAVTQLTPEQMKDFKKEITDNPDLTFYEAKGCDKCHGTGYSGRVSIYEFLLMNDEIRKMIMARATANDIKNKAASMGMKTLHEAGWEKVKEGLSSIQEVIRVTQEEE